MEGFPRQFFREQAIQRYVMRRQVDVVPRFLSPVLLGVGWGLLGLSLLGLLGVLWAVYQGLGR
jgi:hypothetical protein